MTPLSRLRPRTALFWGLVVLGVGVALASARLPGWEGYDLPERGVFVERFEAVATQLGLEAGAPASEAPRVSLVSTLWSLRTPGRRLTRDEVRFARREERPLLVRVAGRRSGSEGEQLWLEVELGLDGRPWGVELHPTPHRPTAGGEVPEIPPELPTVLVEAGEELGAALYDDGSVSRRGEWQVSGASLPQLVEVTASSSGLLDAERRPGVIGEPDRWTGSVPWTVILVWLLWLVLAVSIAGVALLLLSRGRIDLSNGAALAAGGVVLGLVRDTGGWDRPDVWIMRGVFAFLVLVTWSVGESLARRGRTQEETTLLTGLDALRQGRIGRRVAGGLTWGLAVGAALAGVTLALAVLSLDHSWITQASGDLEVPSFPRQIKPLIDLLAAAVVLLGVATAERWLAGRRLRTVVVWALVSVGFGASVLSFLGDRAPWLAAALGVALLLVALNKGGTLALVTAVTVEPLAVVVAFGCLYPSWQRADLAAAVVALSLVGGVALVGAGRRRHALEEVRAPTFLRQATEERRLAAERELIGRIEEDLVPLEAPDVSGWRLSELPGSEETGRLWGVFGHPEAVWLALGSVSGRAPGPSLIRAMVGASVAATAERDPTPDEMMTAVSRGLEGLGGQGGGAWPELAFTVVRLGRADGAVSWARTAGPSPRPLGRPGEPGQVVVFVTDRSLASRGDSAVAAPAEPPHLVLSARHLGGALRG